MKTIRRKLIDRKKIPQKIDLYYNEVLYRIFVE